MEAAVPPMSAPLCLVHNQDCRLSLNPAALAVLRRATQPVVVVAIVGLFNTGKSFLMKRMAQKCTGSPLGNAVQKQTKGIWMWCLPHPCKPGVTLVLLDTEGLENPNNDNIHNDTCIFTLALLLSSTLVYNSIRTDSRTMLGSLCLLTNLRNFMCVRAEADDNEPADEFARVFPDFVWVVRDFRLQENERPISADEYLNQILRPPFWTVLQGNSKVQNCLRSFFPHHKMFMLERPVADRDLAQLEMLREDQLQPRFRQQEEAFCQHIWKEAPVKVLMNSSPVTGRMLACLVETYMAAITTGPMFCVEEVHTVVREAENEAAVEVAVAEYQRGMEKNLVLPTASLSALMVMHQDWKKHVITFCPSQVFGNIEQRYQALLMDKLEVAKEEFCRRNEEASEQRCQEVLKELWGDMELRVQRGDYVVPGGMRLFQKDLKHMQEEYKRRPDKGVKAEAVLEKFLRVKGLEMTEMWLDRVDQQCKTMLAEATAAAQAVEKRLEEHQQQQMVELTKMRAVREMVEMRVCFLEKQQNETLAEVAAVKKAVEKQLKEKQEKQQQQQVMLAEVTAAKKAMEKQLKEQQQQQQVMLAEMSAARKVMEKQLVEQQQQQQQVMLADVTAAKKAMENQLKEQQQQMMMMLAEVTAAKKAMEKQLKEQQRQQQVMLAEVSAAKKAMEKQLEEEQQQQMMMLAEVSAAKKEMEKQLEEQQRQQQVMLAEVSAAKKAMEKQLKEQQRQQQVMLAEVMLAEVTADKKVVKKQLEEQQQQQQVALAKVTAAQEAAEAQLEQQQQQVTLAEVTEVMKAVEQRLQQWAQQLQEEQNLVLCQRLEQLEVQLQEGHGHEAAALQHVEQPQEEETAPSWRSTLLKFLDKVVVPILIRVVNSMVNNAA